MAPLCVQRFYQDPEPVLIFLFSAQDKKTES